MSETPVQQILSLTQNLTAEERAQLISTITQFSSERSVSNRGSFETPLNSMSFNPSPTPPSTLSLTPSSRDALYPLVDFFNEKQSKT